MVNVSCQGGGPGEHRVQGTGPWFFGSTVGYAGFCRSLDGSSYHAIKSL